MHILPYKVNGSDAYSDNYHEESKLVNDGLLVATVIMYLSNVDRGGETVFPNSELKDTQAKDDRLLDCAATGYAVKPVKGDALLFFHLHPNATKDTSSLHVNCRVGEGEKWSATKRIFTKAFEVKKKAFDVKKKGLEEEEAASIMSDNNECTDEDNNCADWAASGECQRNPVFMLGSTDYYGSCRKSCGVC
ncbi:putative prolyl 4-hydroxylase 6 [Iris pallida]|uniref:procollagen-proline 4-dioxygenase n=1 Tax=Iris pallida TaxID=29817 RepID=A0AAX6GXL5_IRIPA|nr:putative prolyl 4-hydroxylase 6 [Iris pallida]